MKISQYTYDKSYFLSKMEIGIRLVALKLRRGANCCESLQVSQTVEVSLQSITNYFTEIPFYEKSDGGIRCSSAGGSYGGCFCQKVEKK